MRDIKVLRQFWRDYKDEPLILCTIVRKKGSGYRDLGAKKIIRQNGDTCGYLSGGCLEGEITRHGLDNAQVVPILYSFSTMSEEDRLLGYQTGCAGIIEVLFERLPDITLMDEFFPYGDNKNFAGISISLKANNLGERKILKESPLQSEDIYFDRWKNPVNLFVIGSGPNSKPFAELANPLGWNVTYLDYRQDYKLDEIPDITSSIIAMSDMGFNIPETPTTAVVLTTHNYEADLQIMSHLSGKKFGYLGCIGPKRRFEKMQEDLPTFYGITMDDEWAKTVKAPAGLHQAHSAEGIAFSIIGEIQAEIGLQHE